MKIGMIGKKSMGCEMIFGRDLKSIKKNYWKMHSGKFFKI